MGQVPYAWSGRDSQGNVASGSGSLETGSGGVLIGMSAPADLWDQRVAEVGPEGLTCRRIFADLVSNGRDQSALISEAVVDGQMPVVSYKLPRDASGNYRLADALSGAFDGWVTNLRNYLNGIGVEVAVVVHHEPRGDLTPAQYIALNKRYIPLLKTPRVKPGCFMNGFLLDGSASAKAEFDSFFDTPLLTAFDWFGIDAYHAGTSSAPDPDKTPGARIRLTRQWLNAKGFPNKPIGIGEYNGHTAAAVADAGEALLSTSNVWFGCVWNSTAGAFVPLTGSRLTAFRNTKSDPRAA